YSLRTAETAGRCGMDQRSGPVCTAFTGAGPFQGTEHRGRIPGGTSGKEPDGIRKFTYRPAVRRLTGGRNPDAGCAGFPGTRCLRQPVSAAVEPRTGAAGGYCPRGGKPPGAAGG